jgi:uncharacterized delta-60 repeat protein
MVKRWLFLLGMVYSLCLTCSLSVWASDIPFDSSFLIGNAANNSLFPTALQTDGKIIVAWWFTWFNGVSINRIARLNPDGTVDGDFINNLWSGANNFVHWIVVQSDGKILVWWDFTAINWIARNRIARLHADGTLDTSFTTPWLWANNRIRIAAVQTDWKIVIWWWFTTYDWLSRSWITRLNPDWTLDTTFITWSWTVWPTPFERLVQTLAIQGDWKIIIWWQFISYNGIPVGRLARLNIDGSLDTSFDTNVWATWWTQPWVYSIVILDDGKLLVSWKSFTSFNGIARNRIVRLHGDWTVDMTFDPGVWFNDEVRKLEIDKNWKIYAWGNFTTYDGIARNRIVRLNSDGSLDTLFDPGNWLNWLVWWITIQSDGKMIPSWDFTDYNGTGSNRITRLNTAYIYQVNFFDDNATLISSWLVEHWSDVVIPLQPVRTGYTFLAWSWWSFTNIISDVDFIAQWTINYYQLNYIAWTWGSIVWSGMQSVPYLWTGTAVIAQANTWYRFMWWSDANNQKTRIDSWLTGNRTLIAQFVLIPNAWTPSSVSTQKATNPINPSSPTSPVEQEMSDQVVWGVLTESDKQSIFNPLFTQTCFDYINKQTIDQWVEVSETFLDAHQLFYSYSLTKRQWTKDYRPFDTITREEAARFFVEFAKNVLCRKPNTTYTAQFSDLADADDTLESFIKASYEFGIFHGDGGSALSADQPRTFRPKALMTQDELAAVIVRLVTNEYDETWWDDRSESYKTFLTQHAKTTLQSSKRENIAEVVYDIYRWNEYVREDIGYVIKKYSKCTLNWDQNDCTFTK